MYLKWYNGRDIVILIESFLIYRLLICRLWNYNYNIIVRMFVGKGRFGVGFWETLGQKAYKKLNYIIISPSFHLLAQIRVKIGLSLRPHTHVGES